jgi:hypothetical protein
MKLLRNVFAEPELVRPLSCQLITCSRKNELTDKTSHDTSDSRGDLEEMGDCLWVEQLVLCRQRSLSFSFLSLVEKRHTGTFR